MKRKNLALTLLTACVAAFTAAFVGCKKQVGAKPLQEGPETGVYYLDDEFGENLLTLSDGGYFTFTYRGKTTSGSYTLKDGALALDFKKDEDGEAVGEYSDGVISVTYGDASLRMLKKEYYSVAFETNGGSAIAAKAVLNGKTLEKPADPEKSGNKFIAWYTDAECKGLPFAFETGAITADTTLYALWAEYDEAVAEYEIKFDLGYDGATLPAASTVGGKLYNVAAPERDGYTFLGWWISAYNDGEKFTAAYAPDYVFNADTTLYALWAGEGENPALMSVDVNGAKWSNVNKAAKITVEGPNGLKAEETVGTTAGNAYNYDFTTKPAGDYKITLESDGKKVERYYLNGALARISGFRVVGNSVLMFNPVAGAEKYLITVECGDPRHNHAEKDNGTSTNYNFVNCPMKVGGITFTVKAVAAGKATSVATYTFDRTLKKAENLTYNAENGLLTWNAVREAAEYVVFVGEDEYNVGNATRFSLKNYSGELAVKVVCKTDGYNSSVAELAVNKTAPVSPADIKINGDTLVWAAAENAVGYVVRIGEKEYETAEATFALGEKIKELNSTDPKGQDYSVSVKTKYENCESLWSDALDVRYYALDKSLTYDRGVLSWNYVVGATEYEVTVNGKAYKTAESEYAVTLTQSGENTLTVRFITADGADDEIATYTVNAYKLTFDSQQGEKVDAVYRATGDPMNLPTELLRDGYDFVGWYNSASASGVYGKRYDEEYFDGNSDIVLYAGWSPKTYTAQLDYNEAGEGADDTAQVTYTKNYTITPPAIKAEHNDKVFAGWFSSPDGKGVQYTDELGNSLRAWQHTADMKLYAVYKDAYKYTLIGADYEVTANPLLAGSKLTELTIPAEHDGKKVVSVGTYAFQGFKRLEKINIPDTVTFIDATAFYGCISLKTYAVYTPEGKTPAAEPAYTAVDGSLLYNNKITGETELVATPSVLTGAYAIPYGVTRLGTRTFYKSGLTEIIVPASVTNVAQEAFLDCKSLTKLSFAMPQGEQKLVSLTLAANSISGCNALETLELPARLNEIPNAPKAFNAFKNLKEINVIGECDEQVYSSLTEKDGQGVNGILTNADKSEIIFCPLKKEFKAVADGNGVSYEFVVPNAVTAIGANAFNMFRQTKETDNVYYALNAITLHSGIVSIGENAFYDLAYLRKVTFGAGNAPLGLTIGESAFEGCRLINTVTFDESDGKVSCVKEIGKRAFYGSSVTSLALPSSLETIGESAFAYCDDLTELDLSRVNGNLTFGAYAFAYCNALPSVEITDNVGEMEFSSVFYKCRTLREVIVPATNPNFESVDGVLYSKGRETILYYPSGLTGNYTLDPATKRIGGGVFSGRDNITEITIPASVTEIGESAFESCEYLTAVNFLAPAADEQAAPLTIGNKAFYKCSALTDIEIPSRAVSVGDECFGSAAALKTAIFNEGLQTIGQKAFFGCKQLESVIIPSTVTEIGAQAFWNNEKLATVTFTPCNGAVTPLILGNNVFQYCKALTNVVLRKGTKNVPFGAFEGCSALESVTIPTTVCNDNSTATRAIAENAFNKCVSLTTVNFALGGDLPLSFARNAFGECTSLLKIDLPARASGFSGDYDVFELGKTTSYSENNYANVVFGASPANYVATAADKKYVVKEYNVIEDGGNFSSKDGVLYTYDKKTVVACPYGKEGAVEIAKEATSFREGAFFGCQFVTELTFEDGGTEPLIFADADSANVGSSKQVFFACPRLTKISFPARLKSIGDYAFLSNTGFNTTVNGVSVYSYGNGLTEVTFAPGCKLESIGKNAFVATKLTSFIVPASVTKLGESIFADASSSVKSTLKTLYLPVNISAESYAGVIKGASALTDVGFGEDGKAAPQEMTIENGVVYDKEKSTIVFVMPESRATLTSLEIPASVTAIRDNAFKGITALTSLTFASAADGEEEKPLVIGMYAFSGTGITSVTLPKRISEMGSYVFSACKTLKDVGFEKGFACPLPDYAFMNCIAIAQVTIPGDIVTLGRTVFSGNKALTTVTFGLTANGDVSQLKEIGADVFNNCSKLNLLRLEKTVKDAEGNPTYENDKLPALTALGESGAYISGPFTKCVALTKIVIPDEVTKIGKTAFEGCTKLTSVTLPKNLTLIRESAFMDCTLLASVKFSDETPDASVTLEESAFKSCKALTSFDFTKVGAFAGDEIFRSCVKLTSVNIHEGIAAGESNYLFDGCTKLKTVVFNPASGSVGDYAFQKCSALTSVTIGENVSAIGSDAFKGLALLTTVDMRSNVLTVIDYNAFSGCKKLKSIALPATLTEIKGKAFYNTIALESVDFSTVTNPAGLSVGYDAFGGSGIKSVNFGSIPTKVGYGAFNACTRLTRVTIPANVIFTTSSREEPGERMFKGCTALTEVKYDSEAAVPKNMFYGCTNLATVTLNDKVTEIGEGAFQNCAALANFALPVGVNEIKKNTFNGCAKLGAITLDGITSLGEGAFKGCAALKSVTLPATLTDIGANAFDGCLTLASITINGQIENLGLDAFARCSDDLSITFADGSDMAYENCALYNGDTLLAYYGKAMSFRVKDGTVAIATKAFNGNATLIEVVLPATLTEIGEYAFQKCAALTTINLKNVKTIGKYAFDNAAKLAKDSAETTGLYIGANTIGNYAFQKCLALESVAFFGVNVSVGQNAFSGCTNLGALTGTTHIAELQSAAFKDSLKNGEIDLDMPYAEIRGGNVFQNATGLKSITLKSISLKANGSQNAYSYIFDGCANLTTVTVTEKVGKLGTNAFKNCAKLTLDGLQLDELTEIGSSAFMNCISVTSITLSATVVKIGSEAFSGWTAEQSIIVDKAESEIVIGWSGWNSSWKNGCNAVITYRAEEAAA